MSWFWREEPESTKFEAWLRLHPWCNTYRVAILGHPTGTQFKPNTPQLGAEISAERIAEFIRAGVEVHITDELSKTKAAHTFEEWWHLVGAHQLPKNSEPPIHAAIAELAWNAAKATEIDR